MLFPVGLPNTSSRASGTLLAVWPVPLAVCQVFTFLRPLLAVQGGARARASEAPSARRWGSPSLRSLRTPFALGIALGRGQHIQGASPWTPLNFPPSGGRRITVSPVSGTWQCLAALSHEAPSPATWGPRRRPPLGGSRAVGEGGRGEPPSQGGGRGAPGPTTWRVV